MRVALVIVGLLLALGAQAETFKWECRALGSSKTDLWLSGDLAKHTGEVKASRLTRPAEFGADGLGFMWTFDAGNFQLVLGPDGQASLYDYTAAAKGEKRPPTEMFMCKEA